MSIDRLLLSPVRALRRQAPVWLGLVAGFVLVACGGGGGDTSSGTPVAATPTVSAYAAGAITGFGSVIVNGVRYEDGSATVEDEEGGRQSATALKLGMRVTIDSGAVDRSAGTATASRIRLAPSLLGPVEAVDSSVSQMTLLGQTVEVTSATVFDATLSGGLSAVTGGAVLEVHAVYDSARALWVATRVEPKTAPTSYRLNGAVAALDTAAQTFQIGAATIAYGQAASVTSALAEGAAVRVRLQTTAVGGQWVATQVRSAALSLSDRSDAEVHGLIATWESATRFTVDGLQVDASAATFPDGQTGVVLGARVEVKGAIVGGVLVATSVGLEDGSASSGTEEGGRLGRHELHGTLSALDTTAKTFVLRGLTVDYASVSEWRQMTEADLAEGLTVEVKGTLSSDGTRVVAVRVSRESGH